MIAPVVDEENHVYYTVYPDIQSSHVNYTIIGGYKIRPNNQYFPYTSGFSFQGITLSTSGTYLNNIVYFHVGNMISYLDAELGSGGAIMRLYQNEWIDYDGNNLNSTMSASSKNNLLFVCGYYICALNMSANAYQQKTKVWCNVIEGGSTQGITPAVDDDNNLVFLYDNGYIIGYDQLNGNKIYEYGNGDIENKCNLEMGCLSSQPIITQYNVVWADGNNVIIFDKFTQSQSLQLSNICDSTSNGNGNDDEQDAAIGNSIAWYKQYLIVSCPYKIVAYQFPSLK